MSITDKKSITNWFLKSNLNSHQNLTYILFSLYGILYTIFSLTIIHLQIFPNINRVTYFDTVVRWSITNSQQYDIVIASLIGVAAVLLSLRRTISIPFSLIIILGIALPVITNIDYSNQIVDLIFLLSLPIIMGMFIVANFLNKTKTSEGLGKEKKQSYVQLNKFFTVFFYVLVALELIVLIRWIFNPFFPLESIQHPTWRLNLLENNLFYAFGLLVPILFVLTFFSPFLKHYWSKIKPQVSKFFGITNNLTNYKEFDLSTKPHASSNFQSVTKWYKITKKWSLVFSSEKQTIMILIVIALIPSALLNLYPYALVTNPQSQLGTDIQNYVRWITPLSTSEDLNAFFEESFIEQARGSRPFSLISIYSLTEITDQSLWTTLKYLPTILSPLLVLSAYFLVRTAYPDNRDLALISAIVTAASHQIVIGFYAAFYANWLALIIMFISTIFLLKSIRKKNNYVRDISLFAISTTSLLFFHSFTWSYFVAAVLLFLGWSIVFQIRQKHSIKVLGILLLVTLAIIFLDVTKSSYIGETSGFQKDLKIAETSVGIPEFAQRWTNLNYTLSVYVGGYLTNFAIMLMLLLWAVTANYKNFSDRFFYCMIFVAILPVLFGDFVVQARIFYNLPFQIPASIMMYKIYKNPNFSFGKPLLIAIILIQFNYAFRAMSNMNFISPIG